jgi:hypothetical protein
MPDTRGVRWTTKPIAAVLAVAFVLLTAAAWGSTTGPGTSGNGGADPQGIADPVVQVQMPPLVDAGTQGQQPGKSYAVPEPGDGADEGGDGGSPGHGKGHGLGNTYCQELKGKSGPAFGHCIAATAHRLHGGHGKSEKRHGKRGG